MIWCWLLENVVDRDGFGGLGSATGRLDLVVWCRILGVVVAKVGFGSLVSDTGSRFCHGWTLVVEGGGCFGLPT